MVAEGKQAAGAPEKVSLFDKWDDAIEGSKVHAGPHSGLTV